MANGSADAGSEENRPIVVATAALTFITLWLRIGVPPLPSKELRVAVLPWQPDNHDVVLGMDYLADHDFAIRRGVFEII